MLSVTPAKRCASIARAGVQSKEKMDPGSAAHHSVLRRVRDDGEFSLFIQTKEAAREVIHGMPSAEWKATRQTPATEEQLARMQASVAKNAQE